MKGIMTDVGLPRIRAHFSTPFILHRTVLTMGMGESWLSERIAAWEDALPVGFKLAYLPSPGRVRLRLSATGSEANVRAEMIRQLARLEVIIPELIYGHDDETIESVVGRLLLERNATLSTAESCTGGLVAHMVTSVPGSSVYFLGSIVAYSYEMKMQHLGVHPDTLSLYGAVSEQAVREMATGVCLATGSTYGIAISGIAGPAGGLPDKPVGTVWIAVHGPDGTRAKRYQFGDDRGRNIERSALTALNMLRKVLVGQ
jgi:nicotinamide-nucleotide amidase